MSEAAVQARLVGALFVERGLVTPEQLERALEIQSTTGELLGEILISEFGLSRVELASVLAEQWAQLERETVTEAHEAEAAGEESAERRRIGEIFVERGFVTQSELEHALEVQAGSGRPLGEVLIDLGNLTRLDLAGALAEQWSGLEKLRPPAPKPAEPWQQVAPIAHAAAVAQGVGRVPEDEPAPKQHDPELATAVEALAARMAALEEAGTSERWAVELRASLDALSARLDSVEASPSPGGTPDAELESLRATLDDLSERITAPEGRLEALEGRLEALAADRLTEERLAVLELRLVETPWVDELTELRGVVEGLAVGVGRPDERLTSLESRVEELAAAALAAERRLEGRVAKQRVLDALEERLAALESRPVETPWVGELTQLRAAVESRLEDVSTRVESVSLQAPWQEEIADVRADLARLREESRREVEPTALNELRDELGDLRRSVAETEAAADSRLDMLSARLDDVARRTDGLLAAEEAGASAVEAQLEAVRGLVEQRAADAQAGLGAVDSELRRRLDELAAGAVHGSTVESLAMRIDEALDALGGRMETVENSVGASASAAGEAIAEHSARITSELASCLDRLRLLEESSARAAAARPVGELELQAALEATEARVAERASVQDETMIVLRRRLEEIAATDGLLSERLREVERNLAASLDGVATRAGDAAAEAARRLAALEESLASTPNVADAVRAALVEVDARIRTAEAAAAAAAHAGAGWEAAAEAVSARVTTVEAALFARESASVEPRVADLERRLADEVSQAEERARTVDRALRKGLAALGQSLADNEAAYAQAGNTLRMSLERLGRVVTDTDARIARRVEGAGYDGQLFDSDAYVAFVPTPDGYRLVAVDGPPPCAGDVVDLEGHGLGLVATRIGTSPIPLDTRACVYLDSPGAAPPG